jgi:hypothetical protein
LYNRNRDLILCLWPRLQGVIAMGKGDKKNIRDSRVRGIGLLELSFFIAVSGLLVATGSPFYKVYENHKHTDVTNATLTQVKTALNTYYQKNGYLPCPAPRNVAYDKPNFGMAWPGTSPSHCSITGGAQASDGTADASGRVVNPASGTNWPIRIGAVPVRTLGLPDTAAIDSWGNLLTYAVTEQYAVPASAPKDMLHGAITITDSKGNSVTASPGIAVFAVVAAGANSVGAWRPETGTQPVSCPYSSPAGSYNIASLATSNCNDHGKFIATTLMSNSGTHLFTNMIAFQADTQACSPQTTASYIPNSVTFLLSTNGTMATGDIPTTPSATCTVMSQAAPTLAAGP